MSQIKFMCECTKISYRKIKELKILHSEIDLKREGGNCFEKFRSIRGCKATGLNKNCETTTHTHILSMELLSRAHSVQFVVLVCKSNHRNQVKPQQRNYSVEINHFISIYENWLNLRHAYTSSLSPPHIIREKMFGLLIKLAAKRHNENKQTAHCTH